MNEDAGQMKNPSYLYKYQRLTAYSLASLINNTVWLSCPTVFNDPFDCAINLSTDKLKESLDHAISVIAEKRGIFKEELLNYDKVTFGDEIAYEKLRKSLKSAMQEIGVLCLSATPIEILMWSHYADNHKGFCVEYDFSEGTVLRRIARPVFYSENIPELSLKNIPANAQNNFLDICIFTKAKQWEYEQEWRAIMHEGNRCFQAPSEVKSIIFGARMPVDEKIMIHQALRNRNILFKEAKLREDRFAIEVMSFKI